MADARSLRAGIGRSQVDPAEDRPEDDPHLELGERRPQAATHPAAEREPGVGLGLALEEALGAEGVGLGVRVWAVVLDRYRRQDERAEGMR